MLGLDWMKKLGITLETGTTVSQIHQIKEDPDVTKLKTKFKKLFNENHTVNGLEVKNTTERRRKTDTTERKTHTDTFTTIGGKRNRKGNKTKPHRKGQQCRRKLLRKPSSHHGNER